MPENNRLSLYYQQAVTAETVNPVSPPRGKCLELPRCGDVTNKSDTFKAGICY